MRTAALAILLAAPLAAQQGSIEGVVLNSGDGQPISGVHIRLFAGVALEKATEAYGAITGSDGRFSISPMPPGDYSVEMERAGFFQPRRDGFMRRTEIEVRPRQHLIG